MAVAEDCIMLENPPLTVTPFGSGQFRSVLGHFCSGITVITGFDQAGTPIGFTCQSFTSVSLDPPLVAICPSLTSQTYQELRKVQRFCVNVLGEDQHDLSDQFARAGTDRFAGINWWPSPTGAPVLEHCLAWIDCETELEQVAGDHYVVLARVVDLGPAVPEAGRRPLLYFRSGYHRLVPIDGGRSVPSPSA